MKKIPTIFERDFKNNPRFVTEEPNPICDWVFKGEGIATRKYDGTCCAILDGLFVKRRELKKGEDEPYGFILADFDEITGKKQGWLEVGNGNEDRYHMEAYNSLSDKSDGTFELVGPRIQGNPDKFDTHILIRHSEAEKYADIPRSFEGIKSWLKDRNIEGIVFHHSDGRMAKIKRRDFDYRKHD